MTDLWVITKLKPVSGLQSDVFKITSRMTEQMLWGEEISHMFRANKQFPTNECRTSCDRIIIRSWVFNIIICCVCLLLFFRTYLVYPCKLNSPWQNLIILLIPLWNSMAPFSHALWWWGWEAPPESGNKCHMWWAYHSRETACSFPRTTFSVKEQGVLFPGPELGLISWGQMSSQHHTTFWWL